MSRKRLYVHHCVGCGKSLRAPDEPQQGVWLDREGGTVCDAVFSFEGGSYPTGLLSASYHYIEGETQRVWTLPERERR